jgi:hypothetical protein
MLNMLIMHKALGADHLLYLEEHGRAVLEDECHHWPNVNAPVALLFDDTLTIFGPRLFVFGNVEDIGEGNVRTMIHVIRVMGNDECVFQLR